MGDPTKTGNLCVGADYKDSANFDPTTYLQWLYNETDDHRHPFSGEMNEFWLETFTNGGVKGKRLLDFASGPCINVAIPASYSFSELYLSDYAPQNRQALQEWLDRKPSHDWTPYFQAQAKHEGSGITWGEIEERVRSRINIIPCDANEQNILEPNRLMPFDCITASVSLESVCQDLDAYKSLLKKFASYLRPKGFLIVTGVYGQTYYKGGNKLFKTITLTQELLQSSLKGAGFEITFLREFFADFPDKTSCDFRGVFFVRAQKQ